MGKAAGEKRKRCSTMKNEYGAARADNRATANRRRRARCLARPGLFALQQTARQLKNADHLSIPALRGKSTTMTSKAQGRISLKSYRRRAGKDTGYVSKSKAIRRISPNEVMAPAIGLLTRHAARAAGLQHCSGQRFSIVGSRQTK